MSLAKRIQRQAASAKMVEPARRTAPAFSQHVEAQHAIARELRASSSCDAKLQKASTWLWLG